MKVALVCQPWDRMLPSQGSVTTSIGIVMQELASRLVSDYDITIYSAADKRSLRKIVEQADGITYRAIPGSSIESRLSLPLKLAYDQWGSGGDRHSPFFATRYYYAYFARQLANDLSEQGFDLIHIANFFQFVPVIRAKNPKAKIVLHMHCDWLGQIDPKLLRPALEQVDLVVGCGSHLAKHAAQRFPDLANRFVTITNGINLQHFHQAGETAPTAAAATEPKRLIIVGRVSPEKGVHIVIDAFKQVRRRLPNVVLDIVGPLGSSPPDFLVLLDHDQRVLDLMKFYGEDGKEDLYYDSLLKMIPPDLKDDVIFHGTIPHEALIDYYRRADVCVNASLSEAFGLPVGEAMASGIPVVAARVGGVPDMVIHGETGLLFEPGDADGLAEAIIECLADPQQSEVMSAAAARRIETLFSWDRIGDSFHDHYAALLAQ